METEKVSDLSKNISVFNGLQYVMDYCGKDQRAIRHNGSSINVAFH